MSAPTAKQSYHPINDSKGGENGGKNGISEKTSVAVIDPECPILSLVVTLKAVKALGALGDLIATRALY
jgi:hypothetical protein